MSIEKSLSGAAVVSAAMSRTSMWARAHGSRRYRGLATIAAATTAAVVAIAGLSGCATSQAQPARHHAPVSAPPVSAAPPVAGALRVCGNAAILGNGPTAAPKGAIVVAAGDDSQVNFGSPNTTYWFAPGVHTLGPGMYTQIDPGNGASFIGAPGAILDGEQVNYYAFVGYATNVTISYLTIENFGTNGGNMNEGVVNHNSGTGWTIDHSTIKDNAGAGVMLGSDNTVSYDCLEDNQQYGFNAYSPTASANLVLEYNEIVGNDTYNWESHDPGCGCTGGGKFWDVNQATVIYNWIYDNHSVGLWMDTDNRGFDIEHNYFQDNYAAGLVYEISYNALVQDNVFLGNAIGEGAHEGGFPDGAIYVSESGSDARVPGRYGTEFLITDNEFIDNWSGVILWENSNRFCGSPYFPGVCTLSDPAVANLNTCTQANLQGASPHQSPDYFGLCRWRTQNVEIKQNTFEFSPSEIGPSCTVANGCGFVGVFSEWGSDPSWSPYQGTVIETLITSGQNNHFADNTYLGPWRFMALELGNVINWQTWRDRYQQDAGSVLKS